MGVFEAVVVFVIAWWLVFLPMLSAGATSQLNAGEVARGTEPSAPATPIRLARKALWAAAAAAVVTFAVWLLLRLGVLAFLFPTPQ